MKNCECNSLKNEDLQKLGKCKICNGKGNDGTGLCNYCKGVGFCPLCKGSGCVKD